MSNTDKLTISPIIYPSVELKRLLNEAIQKSKINTEVTTIGLPDIKQEILDSFIVILTDVKPSDRKAALKELRDEMKKEISEKLRKNFELLGDNVAALFFQTLFRIVFELIDQLIAPFDKTIVYVQTFWNKIILLYKILRNPDTREELKEQIKARIISELINLATSIPYVAEVIALIMLVKTMVKTIKIIRDIKTMRADCITDVATEMALIEELLNQKKLLGSEIIAMVLYVIGLLSPLIQILGSVYCTSSLHNEKFLEVLDEMSKDTEHNTPKIKSKYTSDIVKYAENDINGYSYTRNTSRKTSKRKNNKETTIPVGARYKLKSKNDDGTETWSSTCLDDIIVNINEKDSNIIKCDSPKGELYTTLVVDPILTDTLVVVDPFIDICNDGIDYTDMCVPDKKITETPDGIPDYIIKRNKKKSDQLPSEEEPEYEPKTPFESFKKDMDEIASINPLSDVPNLEVYPTLCGPEGVILEFEKTADTVLFYSDDSDMEQNDLIATVNGAKVYSPKKAKRSKTENNISFFDYDLENGENITKEMESLANSVENKSIDDNEITKITDRFNKLAQTKVVLKDYILPLKLPYIPNDLTDTTKIIASKEVISNIYNIHCDTLIKKYEDDIQNITGKEHVESMLNDNKMLELKDEIISTNNKFFDDVFNTFDTYLDHQNYMCEQSTEKSFYMLVDYTELYSNIVHDDDNEYILELERLLRNFIKERQAGEAQTKSQIILSMSALCDIVIGNKWTFTESYYDKFELFYNENKILFVSNETENVKYKPLYEFLTKLIGMEDTEQKAYEFTCVEDIENIPVTNNNEENEKEEIKRNIKKICNLFILAKEISDTSSELLTDEKERIKELKTQTASEIRRIQNYYNKIKNDYYESLKVLDEDTFAQFRQADVKKMQNVFYNDIEYEHYFITPDDDELILDEKGKELSKFESSSYTEHEPYTMKYWLLYCAQATLVHCILPFYWPCGLNVAGSPIPLPVIYIPIYCLKGDVTMLFGLGICGMFIYPMILFVNFNMEVRSILVPINMVVTVVRELVQKLLSLCKGNLKSLAYHKMQELSDKTKNQEEELRRIDIEILNAKELANGLGRARKERKKKKKEKNKGG